MALSEFLYKQLRASFPYEPTPCQESLFRGLASFLTSDDTDIFVINGYAGSGKTSAMSALVQTLERQQIRFRLMAPTGRSAKVLARYTSRIANTIHKVIYRQSSVKDGIGRFTLTPNRDKDTIYIVDEASLIGMDTGGNSLFGSGSLLDDLLLYVRSGVDNKLILVGDAAQLPPVGMDISPTLDRDFMRSLGASCFADLVTVVRQGRHSGILHNATELRHIINGEAAARVRFDLRGFTDILAINGGELIECISDAYSRYGQQETVVLCRSNKRANRYNAGIRAMVNFSEERLVRGERLMIVKNCYKYAEGLEQTDFIANGDMAELVRIYGYEQRYGLQFATAELILNDYGDSEITAKVLLDTLDSQSASLGAEESEMLYQGLSEDYAHIGSKAKRYKAIREDPYFNALQLKYAYAMTCHKAQGGQYRCVFIDNALWGEPRAEDFKWLYTALTRAVEKVYLVNFPEESLC